MSERAVATRILQRVHADISGPYPDSLGGCRYLLLIVDEFSRKVWGYPIRKKSDAAQHILEWCRAMAAQKTERLAEFHTDGGGEFVSLELKKFFAEAGI